MTTPSSQATFLKWLSEQIAEVEAAEFADKEYWKGYLEGLRECWRYFNGA